MGRIKVLYAEDEPSLGRIVKESLEDRNLDVMLVADGAQVMQTYDSFQPDICVLDIMLPNKDGYSIASEIRKKAGNIPIIFLTAKTQTEDLLQGFKSGGNDYLKKPFSMEELIVRIKNLVSLSGHTEKKENDYIQIGSFSFFPEKYELQYGDMIKKLSFRETTLLRMLTGTSAPVLRRDILLELWGDDSFFNSRNLDVYITKLREYFKKDQRVQIITLRGVGYHLVVL